MPSGQRAAAIVGIHEHPLRVEPSLSVLQIKADCARLALEDAGLSIKDVDGLYDTGDGGGVLPPITLAEYFGIHPRVIDTTMVGGSSYEFLAAHAKRDIAAGRANVALITYGSRTFSDGLAPEPELPIAEWNLEEPYGPILIAKYAMAAKRHTHEFGTTPEQLAEIAVATRMHAMRNPDAVRAMRDLGFKDIGEITIADVLNSPVIADPIKRLECCMISDGGGAVVIASKDVVKGTRKKPVWVLGGGEALGFSATGEDVTTTAAAKSAPDAFAEAGVSPSDVDLAMIYDSFTITVLTILEDLGFCKKGEGGAFVQGGRLRYDSALKPALNTDGGGLSSNHPGMRGIFLLIEAVRQLRGESTSQIADARLAVAHGNGGWLGTRHAGGTVVLARD
jgi:acetyl-CoA C-acetyltransferase